MLEQEAVSINFLPLGTLAFLDVFHLLADLSEVTVMERTGLSIINSHTVINN